MAIRERHFLLGGCGFAIFVLCLEVVSMPDITRWWRSRDYHVFMLLLLTSVSYVALSAAASSAVRFLEDEDAAERSTPRGSASARAPAPTAARALRSCFPFLALPLMHIGVALITGQSRFDAAVLMVPLLLSGALLQFAAGSYFSSRSERPSRALVRALSVGLAANVVLPFLAFEYVSSKVAYLLSPVLGITLVAGRFTIDRPLFGHAPGAILEILAISTTVYIGFSCLLLWRAHERRGRPKGE